MRNRIMSIIALLLIILLIRTIFWGIKIGNFQVLSIADIMNKDEQLDQKISTASTLTTVDYKTATDNLEKTYEKRELKEKEYDETIELIDNKNNTYYETKKYDISYIWEEIGRYANEYNLVISMDVEKTATQDFYNLNFKVLGEYIKVSQLIDSIENNPTLAFRIYNFKLTANVNESGTVFKNLAIAQENYEAYATFSIKNIKVNKTTLK